MVEIKENLFFPLFIYIIVGIKAVSMEKRFVEETAQTTLLEVKAVHLDIGSSCTEHNSQLTHYQ